MDAQPSSRKQSVTAKVNACFRTVKASRVDARPIATSEVVAWACMPAVRAAMRSFAASEPDWTWRPKTFECYASRV